MADLSALHLYRVYLHACYDAAQRLQNASGNDSIQEAVGTEGIRAVLAALVDAGGDVEALVEIIYTHVPARTADDETPIPWAMLHPYSQERYQDAVQAVAAAAVANVLALADADLPAPDAWWSECVRRGYDRQSSAEYQAWLDMQARIAMAAAVARKENERLRDLLRRVYPIVQERVLWSPERATPEDDAEAARLAGEIDAALGGSHSG
jgi:hypothetical protein